MAHQKFEVLQPEDVVHLIEDRSFVARVPPDSVVEVWHFATGELRLCQCGELEETVAIRCLLRGSSTHFARSFIRVIVLTKVGHAKRFGIQTLVFPSV